MNRFYFIILIYVFSSCAHPEQKELPKEAQKAKTRPEADVIHRSKEFQSFLSKFKLLQLPLVIHPFKEQDMNGRAVIFGSDTAIDKTYAFGLLSDTAENFKILYWTPSEIYLPVLATYAKDGRKISEKDLSVGECGSGCCFTCTETIRIELDQTIYAADSISQCECEQEVPNMTTMKKDVYFRRGRIIKNGTVQLSDIKHL